MANENRSAPQFPLQGEPPPPSPVPPSPSAPLVIGSQGPRIPAPVDAPAPKSPNLEAAPGPDDETVTLTIDGQEIRVRKGTNVLEAAKLLEKDICHFCYHPGLSVAASCRQCLVEIEKSPKLVPSCQAIVTDGMVVYTESQPVLEARRAMLEFTLKNHPIDCPICDKAGECTLQRHYMDHDHALTRVDVPKIRKPKHKDIGREIVLDAERCILCSRCIRFCDELPKTGELCMSWRSDHEQIDIAEGHRLDNAYSLNVVDICPVGALTAKDFRFKVRAWELKATETTCPGCATGCAVELHSRHEEAYRLIPAYDPDVNGYWMCDEGRYTYKRLDSSSRVRHAVVDGTTFALSQAILATAERLRKPRGRRVAVVFSAQATNESNEALAELADFLDAQRFVLGRNPGLGDDILRDTDKNPNTRGALKAAGETIRHEAELALELAGRAFDAVIFLDDAGDLSEVSLRGLKDVASICLASSATPLAEACAIALPAASWAEILGTFTNRQDRLRVLQPAWRPEGDRLHRADLIRELSLAIAGPQMPTARERTRALAEHHQHAQLMEMLANDTPPRPTLLRFGHSRG